MRRGRYQDRQESAFHFPYGLPLKIRALTFVGPLPGFCLCQLQLTRRQPTVPGLQPAPDVAVVALPQDRAGDGEGAHRSRHSTSRCHCARAISATAAEQKKRRGQDPRRQIRNSSKLKNQPTIIAAHRRRNPQCAEAPPSTGGVSRIRFGPTNQKVLHPPNPQAVPECPAEGVVDPLSGAGLRRQILGHCATGDLIVGSVAMAPGCRSITGTATAPSRVPANSTARCATLSIAAGSSRPASPTPRNITKSTTPGVFGCAQCRSTVAATASP